MSTNISRQFPAFARKFFDSTEDFTIIGTGELGGKATGLAFMHDLLAHTPDLAQAQMTVSIPRLTVITTEYFEEFMAQNRLYDDVYADLPDYLLAHKFQQAELPVMMLGDLRSLIEQVHTPLAIRSSSLLEDALHEPFAGIYETKMIPNNQPSPDTRFQKLIEAIKFVYASTFFKQARAYLHATQHALDDEKMAVIIQEVVGKRHQDRFYPNISGVARSYNFYPTGRATPESGIVSLALGLGKTIVDGGNAWFYSPAYPKVFPPHATPRDLLKQTQLQFWAVNMGPPPEYDPTRETEYLVQSHISSAERDGTLAWVASTYDPHSD
ncbi:phosphoenolpyruvate synthase, partial [candidate division KSB3 bacterium]|nr:phosphoenolpyruvate synthase [candidate division KSB3 bacterium]MBD3327562.1 phosphoenolpyruvate synthase [candidate division KSB3 bacterium]